MAKSLSDTIHPRPHPTVREFAELLEQWGFKPVRGRHPDPRHRTLRGPHGGRLQILTSLQGRADADQIARAARLAHVAVEVFLGGPGSRTVPSAPAAPAGDALSSPVTAATAAASARQTRRAGRSSKPGGDSVVSLVLTTHARHDRPMRFEEVVDLCGGRVTRTQVREASANLCRTGKLDRICDGVYQWAHGVRRTVERSAPTPAPPHQLATPPIAGELVDELFATLFPRGLRMTPPLLRDLQRWTELTRALAAHAED